MTPLYTTKSEFAIGLPPSFWAIDTETTLFQKPTIQGKTRTSPFVPGRLVLVSIAGHGAIEVWDRRDGATKVYELLENGQHLIFHNAAYDVPVLINYEPMLKSLFVKAYRENRIHCTKVLEVLTRIAKGVEQRLMHAKTTLADLARKYAGIQLDKKAHLIDDDEDIRLGFETYESGEVPVPPDALEYSAMDAVATYAVYGPLSRKAKRLAERPHRGVVNNDAAEKFGPLCERNHTMGDLALSWLSSFPIRVDRSAIEGASNRILLELSRYEDILREWTVTMPVVMTRKAGPIIVDKEVHWARRVKRKEVIAFCLFHKAIRFVLHGYALAKDLTPEVTSTGEVTLEREYWADHIPRMTPETWAQAEEPENIEARLSLWLAYTRLRMMMSRYIEPMMTSEFHWPRYMSLGARTTRTSASKIPIQQIPKHKDSLRGAFIPEDNRVFIEADYRSAELTALAQTYFNVYGGSKLGDAINRGDDPHISVAKDIFPDFNSETEERQKELRQACKAVNFGLPGGMGAATFAKFAAGFGVTFTLEEARQLRKQAIRADPELGAWLGTSARDRVTLAARNLHMTVDSLANHLGTARSDCAPNFNLTASRLRKWENGHGDYEIPTPIGFDKEFDLWKENSVSVDGTMRGGCFYCDARNLPFQSGIASVGKAAMFNLWAEHSSESVWQPAAFIHDSILLQTSGDADAVLYAQDLLRDCMGAALKEVCPDINGGLDVGEPMQAWGKLGGVFA